MSTIVLASFLIKGRIRVFALPLRRGKVYRSSFYSVDSVWHTAMTRRLPLTHTLSPLPWLVSYWKQSFRAEAVPLHIYCHWLVGQALSWLALEDRSGDDLTGVERWQASRSWNRRRQGTAADCIMHHCLYFCTSMSEAESPSWSYVSTLGVRHGTRHIYIKWLGPTPPQ